MLQTSELSLLSNAQSGAVLEDIFNFLCNEEERRDNSEENRSHQQLSSVFLRAASTKKQVKDPSTGSGKGTLALSSKSRWSTYYVTVFIYGW